MARSIISLARRLLSGPLTSLRSSIVPFSEKEIADIHRQIRRANDGGRS